MICVRPILHTPHAEAWGRLLVALGAELAIESGPWREYDTSSGTVAVSATPGGLLLGFTETDLAGLEERARAAGVAAQPSDDGVGAALRVTAPSGFTFLVDEAYRTPRTVAGALTVLQLRYQPDVREVGRTFEGIGLRPRVLADDPDGWADFAADGGGLAAQHRGADERVELSFEYAGDLDALRARLREAGFAATIVDEAYNRTLLVPSPDGGDVWVNGVIEDLYGYHRGD